MLPLLLLVLVLLLATAATAEGMGAGLLRGEGPERELKPVEGLMEGIAPALGKASGVDADMVCDGVSERVATSGESGYHALSSQKKKLNPNN